MGNSLSPFQCGADETSRFGGTTSGVIIYLKSTAQYTFDSSWI